MKVSLGVSSNDRQPEMAVETGNTYISKTKKKEKGEVSGFDQGEFKETSPKRHWPTAKMAV